MQSSFLSVFPLRLLSIAGGGSQSAFQEVAKGFDRCFTITRRWKEKDD